MAQPAILYRNLLQIAADGRGDGTIYGYGTGATPSVSAKTFDLTAGIQRMADLAAGDGMYIGYQLVFTASGRSYLVTAWLNATEVATVYETPNAEDTGAWTLRRTYHSDDFNVAYPLRNSINGRLYQYWKDSAANSVVGIWAAAPNGVDDCGFEINLAPDGTNPYWARVQAGTGTVTINSTSPILGTYDCKLNRGDQTFVTLYQAGKIDLRAGYTYGIIMKAGGDGGAVTDCRVSIRNVSYGGEEFSDTTFTKTAAGSGDALADIGNGTSNEWRPAISDANAWEEVTFTISDGIDAGDWYFVISQYDATDVFIDQIYLWEIGPTISGGAADQADVLLAAGHNFTGGFAATSAFYGCRAQADLSSMATGDLGTASNDMEQRIDMDANVDVIGKSPMYESFTVFAELVPIYEILLANVAAKTWQAAELWVGKLWTWEKYPEEPITNKLRTIETVSATSRGGVVQSEKLYQKKIVTGTQDMIDSSEINMWLDFVEHSGHGKPFWLRIGAVTGLGVSASTEFMKCKNPPVLEPDPPTFYKATFSFEEAK